jgi:hypothetical protein
MLASLTRKFHANGFSHTNLLLNCTENSLRHQKLGSGFFIRPLNSVGDVYRISNGSDSLLQATAYRANDCIAKVHPNPNPKTALEQSLHIRLYILFYGAEHIKASQDRLEGRRF